MGQARPSPTDAHLWHAEAWDFLSACVTCSPAELDDRIREASHLFRLASHALGISLPLPAEETAIEALLTAGGRESAVLSLLGRETAFMVSRGMNGSNLATVILPGRTEEFTARGSTLELALLTAKAAALLAEAEQVLSLPQSASAPVRARTWHEAARRQG